MPCRDTGRAASFKRFLQRYHFNVIVYLLVKNAQPTRIVRPLFLPAALEEDQEQPEDLQTSEQHDEGEDEPCEDRHL